MIVHRPPEELLLGYASGSLPEPIALVVASHAALCPETAREILRLERVGGGLLDAIAPAEMSAGALDRALAQLDGTAPAPPRPIATPETRALLPAPAWPYVNGDIGKAAWRRRSADVDTADLVADGAKRRAFLLRVKAGRPVPRHTHRGLELTLVLTGAYCDAANCFERGDLQVADPTVDHRPIARPGDDCICLVALDAPIRFTGAVGRFANPFVRL
jgi:putative transcriptional regulator